MQWTKVKPYKVKHKIIDFTCTVVEINETGEFALTTEEHAANKVIFLAYFDKEERVPVQTDIFSNLDLDLDKEIGNGID